ncbi:hypothetical protein GIB67_012605 [Kingdonia uniflora]|uniref:Thioesterase domain-containing protein n=1 Tax=Kingdonia uniflora TaxID=39325 RepID=A0A7J7NFQ8_9MAGN|nr:hypothetical protein GIB67_012605 [Kingdonia uniflora]
MSSTAYIPSQNALKPHRDFRLLTTKEKLGWLKRMKALNISPGQCIPISTTQHTKRRRPVCRVAVSNRVDCCLSSRMEAFGVQNANGNGSNRFYDHLLQVQDCELDQYGVVHNAVYATYCHRARDELCKRIGLCTDNIARTGDSLALSELSLKFIAPLRSDDWFVVKVGVSGSSAARIFFEHFIFKLPNQELILEAKATGVWLNHRYRPVRIASDVRSKFLEFLVRK